MTKYFLGIDIGATKSHALIANEQGEAIGFGQAGSGNWEAVGWEQTRQVFQEITEQALQTAGIKRKAIAGAGFGIAGYDWPEDLAPHEKIVASLELNAPCYLTNDTIIGLVAGAKSGWGVVISAGTSNNCRGRSKNGTEAYLTGSGESFAEYGGAYQTVRKAIQAVSLAWSLRGPQTQLTEEFIKITGAKDTTDLLAGLIRERYHLDAKHAPIIFVVAKEGDRVAQDIIHWTGEQLADLALGIARKLDFLAIDFEVVLAGSLFKGGAGLTVALKNKIHEVAPGAHFVRLNAPPVVGGVLLGMEMAQLDASGVRPRLFETANQFLNS